MSSAVDPAQQQDDEGEWEEMPVLRSQRSQLPRSGVQEIEEEEQRKSRYQVMSPARVAAGAGANSALGVEGYSATSGSKGSRAARTGNATGHNLDIDDARGYNWRSKPAGEDTGQSGHRPGNEGDAGSDEDDDDDGGGAKGYTQLRIEEDEEAEQIYAATEYLFGADIVPGQDLPTATPVSQLATTKQMLTDQQKIAYVGVTSLATREIVRHLERIPGKEPALTAARTSTVEWRQKVMARLYQHMGIEDGEQNMIDSLAQHGVLIEDLTPALITTQTVANPEYDPEAAQQERERQAVKADDESPPSDSEEPEEGDIATVDTIKETEAGITTADLEPEEEADITAANTVPKEEGQSTTAESQQEAEADIGAGATDPDHDREADIGTAESQQEAEPSGKEDKDAMAKPLPDAYDTLPIDEEEVKIPEAAKMEDALPATDKNITLDIRWTVLCDLFLVLTADGIYDARSRVLLERIAEALGLTLMDVTQFEKRVTDALEIEEGAAKLRDKRVIADREKSARNKRYVMMGLATVGGGLVIGLSAGLLAPVIGAGLGAALGAVGIGGTGTFLGGVGGAAIITTTGTLAGAGVAGKGMNRRTRSVKTFEFKAIHNNKRVNCIIGMPGFMSGPEDDVRLPFGVLDSVMGDAFSVLWEPDMMQEMGNSLSILWNETLTQGVQQLLALTVAGGLVGALTWPMWLLKLGYFIDNPWSNALDRAKAAGLILADCLAKRQLGVRPITLIGFSLGARAIFYALVELAKIKAFGVVENVFIMGTPVTASDSTWKEARSVVAGRFVNVFSRTDWILGYLYRATSGGLRSIAGLHPVDRVPDIENVDVTHVIPGHLAYRALMPLVLGELQFRVTADYFDEPVDLNKIPIRQVVAEEEQEEQEKAGKLAKMFRRGTKETLPDIPKDAQGSRSGTSTSAAGAAATGSSGTQPAAGTTSVEPYEYDEDLPERMPDPSHPFAPAVVSPPPKPSPPERISVEPIGTPTQLGVTSPHFDAEAILAELRESGIQVRELESSLPPLIASNVAGPSVPPKHSGPQLHSLPQPVHDRKRTNSMVPAPSPLGGPPTPAACASLALPPSESPHPSRAGPPSPALRPSNSSMFNTQEDMGTSRDRGLSRQLPSLSTTSVYSHGQDNSSFHLDASPFGSSHRTLMEDNAPGSAPASKSSFGAGLGFGSSDLDRWGSASVSTSNLSNTGFGRASATDALSSLPPPPQETSLTFAGEDGELSFGTEIADQSASKPPWQVDNPWS
ncbi:hypothetical protein OC845_004802 [Tilletia horrida]|nr:hypothetical protein OC845_004802 [Tilletia horrida]